MEGRPTDLAQAGQEPAGGAAPPETTPQERLVAEVRGRVQGVGFRDFVCDWAQRLGLRGYTRNLPDGRHVEVVAEGPRPALERLLEALRRGPPGAWVERVRTGWEPAAHAFRDFTVRR
jgi:acylphosphatase